MRSALPTKKQVTIKDFLFGRIDTLEDKSIPRGAVSAGLNWLTKGDRMELRGGYRIFGNELTGAGKITGQYTAKKSNGTEIQFRTRGAKVEYYIDATETWTEIGTNILGTAANGKDISFAGYNTAAGDQLFICSPYGPLLKIMLANPGDYADMYDATKNYKGYIKIKLNRMILWGRIQDKSTPYLSHIDEQNFTTVTNENVGTGDGATLTFNDTLAFKGGGSKRTCFAITATDGTESFTDNYDGTLTGSAGGTGTINYMTGAISLTFAVAPANLQAITCNYQWEDSTNGGICDFTYSAPRTAGEGTFFRQDSGGALQNIESYGDAEYCYHEKTTWVFKTTNDDTNATNEIYRENVGISNWRGSVATGEGVFYMDDKDQTDPQLRLLTLNLAANQVIPVSISKGRKYKNISVGVDLSMYVFNAAVLKEWGDYITIACKSDGAAVNDTLILYNRKQGTFDFTDFYASTLDVYGGMLLGGDPLLNNVNELFSGYDDNSAEIPNSVALNKDILDWDGGKKLKQLILKGQIGVEQSFNVYASIDGGDYGLIGTVSASSQDIKSGTAVVGRTTMGTHEIGGGGSGQEYGNFIATITVNSDVFNNIKLKFEGLGIGQLSISDIIYFDIRIKNQRIRN